MATKKQIMSWNSALEKRQKALATERDKLDEVISGLGDLRDCCDRAWADIQSARDALSELV